MKTLFTMMFTALLVAAAVLNAQSVSNTGLTQATQDSFSLAINKPDYCVGESTRYVITGLETLIGKPVAWSFTFVPYGTSNNKPSEVFEGSYSGIVLSKRDDGAFWTGLSGIWSIKDVGEWTKTASIDGVSKKVTFTVRFCGTEVLYPRSMRLVPSTGHTFSHRLGSVFDEKVEVMFDNMPDFSRVASLRIIVDEKNETTLISKLPMFYEDVFSVEYRQQPYQSYWSPARSIRFTYPPEHSQAGTHRFRVEVTMVDNSVLIDSAEYTVRDTIETVQLPLPATADSTLVCAPDNQLISLGQGVYAYAHGGDGAYSWSMSGSLTTNTTGPNAYPQYNAVGQYNLIVTSGGQQQVCKVTVVNTPPQLAPPPTPAAPPTPLPGVYQP